MNITDTTNFYDKTIKKLEKRKRVCIWGVFISVVVVLIILISFMEHKASIYDNAVSKVQSIILQNIEENTPEYIIQYIIDNHKDTMQEVNNLISIIGIFSYLVYSVILVAVINYYFNLLNKIDELKEKKYIEESQKHSLQTEITVNTSRSFQND